MMATSTTSLSESVKLSCLIIPALGVF
jgi:hypothetical protein